MDNMHGRIPKKICENVLEKLTSQNHLSCKEFGKAKIYLANQDKFPTTSQSELDALDLQISTKRGQLDQQTDQLKQLTAKLKDLTATLSNEQLAAEIESLKRINVAAETALNAYRSGGIKQVTEEEVNEVKTDYSKYQKHWRTRRRACLEIVDMICDSVDMNRREFFEKVGLEPDEDYGVALADFPAYSELK